MKSSPFKWNWELSTARAVAVVRFLQAEGVDPRHLGAAGFSEFDPVAQNDTDVERAMNRRMEIEIRPLPEELPPIDLAPATPAVVNGPAPAAPIPTTPLPPAQPTR